MESTKLEHFSAVPKTDINSTTPSLQLHAEFHSFLSNNSKQDAENTTAHSNIFISLLKDKIIFTTSLATIYETTYGCAKQYRCASILYLMSVMSQCCSIIIVRGISAPGHGKELLD